MDRSIDSVPPARRDGFTLVETMVASTLLLILVFVVTTLGDRGGAAQRYAARVTRATELGQDLLSEMRRHVSASVRLMHDDALGNGYLAMLDLPFDAERLRGRLPRLRSAAIFEREASGNLFSGNVLLLARHAWTDTYACIGTGNSYSVDVYRFCCYYLRPDGAGVSSGSPIGLNLCRYLSEPLADGEQVDAITDPADRAEVLRNLLVGRTTNDIVVQPDPIHPRLEVVWVLDGDPGTAGTLRQIDPGSLALSNTPLPPRQASWRILRDPALTNEGLLQYRHYSVATNWAVAGVGVGRFSLMDLAGEGFPHGLEVQIIGPASARQVLMRLSLQSTVRSDLPAWSTTQLIQDCRDL